MKGTLIIIALIISMSFSKGQNVIEVQYNAKNAEGKRLEKVTTDKEASLFDPSQSITVNVVNLPEGINANLDVRFNKESLDVEGSSPNYIVPALSEAEIPSPDMPYNFIITVPPKESATYRNVATPTAPGQRGGTPDSSNFPDNLILQQLSQYFPAIVSTDFGFTIESSNLTDFPYTGDNFSHIFLDQFGNTILGTIPQGISNRSFVVHVVYLTNSENPYQISYSVKQTKGSYNPTLVFNNAGQLGGFSAQGSRGDEFPINYAWAHQYFLLRTSTNNIEFEVSRNILNENGLLSLSSTLVARHVIEMSKVYHGSFDIGIIGTKLADPSYQLVPSINDPDQMVVKQSNIGQRGILTAMVTFYTSPVILLEKYIAKKDIPNYKVTGRNFLDDHKIYERIFPAIGVSISEKAVENWFLGLNWEIARGASVFTGIHFGKINTFEVDDDFHFGESLINEAEFNLRLDRQWKSKFSIGANLDILVVTNLFRQ